MLKDPMIAVIIAPFVGEILVPLKIRVGINPLELLVKAHELTGISPEFLQIEIFLKDQQRTSTGGSAFLTNDQIVHEGGNLILVLGLS